MMFGGVGASRLNTNTHSAIDPRRVPFCDLAFSVPRAIFDLLCEAHNPSDDNHTPYPSNSTYDGEAGYPT